MRLMLAGVSVLALTGPGLLAAPPQGAPVPGLEPMKQALGLTDEQATQLRRLRGEERKDAIRRHADLAIARMELQEALAAPTVDEKLVAAKVKAVTELQASAERTRVDRQLALRRVLTPEQFQKLRQGMWQRHARARMETRQNRREGMRRRIEEMRLRRGKRAGSAAPMAPPAGGPGL